MLTVGLENVTLNELSSAGLKNIEALGSFAE